MIALLKDYRKENKIEPFDELWVVIDTDEWDIPDAIAQCEKEGFHLGLSNRSFESWILLHFEEITMDAMDSLLALNNDELMKRIKIWHPRYTKTSINPATVCTRENMEQAIAQAKRLLGDKEHPLKNCFGSSVYKLVEKIIR